MGHIRQSWRCFDFWLTTNPRGSIPRIKPMNHQQIAASYSDCALIGALRQLSRQNTWQARANALRAEANKRKLKW